MGCSEHSGHQHTHGYGCGHRTVAHEGHTDYLHDGHLHNLHGGHIDEHQIAASGLNPSSCTPSHHCAEHGRSHAHKPGCGHESIPHGDHVDFVVGGHLHHPHGEHCDDHGPVRMA